jgi:hypothetical protein
MKGGDAGVDRQIGEIHSENYRIYFVGGVFTADNVHKSMLTAFPP